MWLSLFGIAAAVAIALTIGAFALQSGRESETIQTH